MAKNRVKLNMEMKKYKLGDIADINKQTLSKKDSMDVIEYLDTGSLTENIFGPKQVLSRKEAPSRAQRRVFDKTILYSTVRPRLKHYGFLESPKENTIVSTGFATIDVKDEFKNVIDARYLYLLLIQDKVTEYLGTIADTAVSAYPSLNPSDIQSLEFEFPDMPIQKKVASFLCNIDKRIENLRAQNRVLEQTAKTIYDYTFLQCAGRKTTYNKTLNRNIPANWEVKKLGDLLTIKNGKDHKHLKDGPFAVYGSGGLMRKVDSFLYDGESVLIPRKGTLNNVMYVDEKFWTVDRMFYSVMNKPYYGKYIYYSVRDIDFMARNSGTGVPSMTSGYLNTISIILPDAQTLENFNNQVTPLFKKVQLNTKQIETLTNQRNTLLPLLMNGQIVVG